MDGRVDEAIKLLNAQVASHPNDGATHLLLCRAYISVQRINAAISECETAVRLTPKNSSAQDWLGRAYGLKANNAGPFTGLKLAHEVREAFITAVSLDRDNEAAVNDLAEYYVDAPSLVGGGTDKADDLADRVQGYLPQTAHRIHALSAEKRGDYKTAEREFTAATSVKNSPEAWVDLGGFYKRRRETTKAVEALRQAYIFDSTKNAAVVDVASYLIDMGVEPVLARKALEQYLTGDAKSDAAPVVHVDVMLGHLLELSGDIAAAKSAFERALQLAAGYGPAIKALNTSENRK